MGLSLKLGVQYFTVWINDNGQETKDFATTK